MPFWRDKIETLRKKISKKNTGVPPSFAGGMPVNLLKYADRKDIARKTSEFAEALNRLAYLKAMKWDESDPYKSVLRPRRISGKNKAEQKAVSDLERIFDQKVELRYISKGSRGAVYVLFIGEEALGFKIMHASRYLRDEELVGFVVNKKHRSLAKKIWLGGHVRKWRKCYSWSLSEWVPGKSVKFGLACEKLFYARLTKGIFYGDWDTPGNIAEGKVIDLGSFRKEDLGLARKELDAVRRLVFHMKSGDAAKFESLLARIAKSYPKAFEHLSDIFLQSFSRPPEKLNKFTTMVAKANYAVNPDNPELKGCYHWHGCR